MQVLGGSRMESGTQVPDTHVPPSPDRPSSQVPEEAGCSPGVNPAGWRGLRILDRSWKDTDVVEELR